MKQVWFLGIIMMLVIMTLACNSDETHQSADTTHVPPATDTMPVLNPGVFDSSGTIRTPSTGDDNVIMPDSAVKKQQ